MTTLLHRLALLLAGLSTQALPAIHRRDRERGGRGGEDLGRAHGRCLQHGTLGDQEGFDGFTEVVHEMEAVDYLHGLRGPSANPIRIQGTPIATDDSDRRMLGEPSRGIGGGAVRQQVHNAAIGEVDRDRPVPMASPPGPLVHAHGLEGGGTPHWSRPHQPKKRGGTYGQLQAGGEPNPCLPTQR
jgi:hypothetical protein